MIKTLCGDIAPSISKVHIASLLPAVVLQSLHHCYSSCLVRRIARWRADHFLKSERAVIDHDLNKMKKNKRVFARPTPPASSLSRLACCH